MGSFFNMKIQNKHSGFSLVELLISMVVGIALLGGVLSVFVGMKTTTSETTSYGALQENGRFALNLITEDLLRQNFWGDLAGTLDSFTLTQSPNSNGLAGECFGGGANNGSFPRTNGHFRTLWGTTVTNLNTMCMTDAIVGSDILQLKRAISFPFPDTVADPLIATDLAVNRYYIKSNSNSAAIFNGAVAAIPDVNLGRVWQYQHHIYYVSEENNIPVLNRGTLQFGGAAMNFTMVVDGIERLYFMYGVDTDNDGAINAFISADNMTDPYWDNGSNSRILAVKVYILVRDILPDNKYENENIYQMGDTTFTPVPGDNFRRLLFSSTVALNNARLDVW